MKMHILTIKLLHPFLMIAILISSLNICQCKSVPPRFCGKLQLQAPFLSLKPNVSSPLTPMITCRSHKLYMRTTLGLFQVSSVDYSTKTLTISPPSCSSSLHYVSPSSLQARFPTPLQPNSLLLFNCSNLNHSSEAAQYINCSNLSTFPDPFAADHDHQDSKCTGATSSCLIVHDIEKLDKGFHPNDLKCSHYCLVHRTSQGNEGYELGTRMSFDVPDHVPNLCNECEKPNGNCGVGLRCLCHPQSCKDKIISIAGSVKNSGNLLFSLLAISLVLVSCLYS